MQWQWIVKLIDVCQLLYAFCMLSIALQVRYDLDWLKYFILADEKWENMYLLIEKSIVVHSFARKSVMMQWWWSEKLIHGLQLLYDPCMVFIVLEEGYGLDWLHYIIFADENGEIMYLSFFEYSSFFRQEISEHRLWVME